MASDAVTLVCVDPERSGEVWPLVSDMLRVASVRTDMSHFHALEEQVLSGRSLLWLAWNGSSIEAAAVTNLVRVESGTCCVITSCAGRDRKRWLPLLAQIEDFARKEGCTRIRIFGRKGWARALKDYDVRNIVLEKLVR